MGIRATTDSAQPSVHQGPGRAAGRYPHLVAVGALTAVAAAGYSVFALVLNYTFQTSSYDLVIFDQTVRSYTHFSPGISIIKGPAQRLRPGFLCAGRPLVADHRAARAAVLDRQQPADPAGGAGHGVRAGHPPIWVFTRRAFGGGNKATIAAYLAVA